MPGDREYKVEIFLRVEVKMGIVKMVTQSLMNASLCVRIAAGSFINCVYIVLYPICAQRGLLYIVPAIYIYYARTLPTQLFRSRYA
jgi:hypothetical protein